MQTNSPTASKSLLWAAATSLEVIWVLSTVQPRGPSCPACQHPQPRQQPLYTADPPTSRNRACRRHAPRGCSPSEAVTHLWFINMLKYKSGGGGGEECQEVTFRKTKSSSVYRQKQPHHHVFRYPGMGLPGPLHRHPFQLPLSPNGEFSHLGGKKALRYVLDWSALSLWCLLPNPCCPPPSPSPTGGSPAWSPRKGALPQAPSEPAGISHLSPRFVAVSWEKRGKTEPGCVPRTAPGGTRGPASRSGSLAAIPARRQQDQGPALHGSD